MLYVSWPVFTIKIFDDISCQTKVVIQYSVWTCFITVVNNYQSIIPLQIILSVSHNLVPRQGNFCNLSLFFHFAFSHRDYFFINWWPFLAAFFFSFLASSICLHRFICLFHMINCRKRQMDVSHVVIPSQCLSATFHLNSCN